MAEWILPNILMVFYPGNQVRFLYFYVLYLYSSIIVDEKLEQDRATVDKVFEELSSHDNKIDKELFQQKVCVFLFNKRFMVVFKDCPHIWDASSIS